MSTSPPVSIVLPVRNGGAFFAEALESLRIQTFEHVEILVQDDGSTDGSIEVARDFAARDPRFLLQTGIGYGVAHAATTATERARGELIVRMDADDIARPERVACLVELADAHPEAGYFGSRARFFPRESVGPGMAAYEAWHDGLLTHEQIFRDRYVEYPIPHPSTALRRSVWKLVGGFRDGPFPEDYDHFLRAAAAGVRFAKHPDVLLDWREGQHRTTKKDKRYGLDRFHELKLEHLAPELRALKRPIGIVGAGRDGKRWARSLRAVDLAPACFVDVHPGRIGQRIQDIPVIGYDELRPADGAYLLSAVGAAGARNAVRAALRDAGLVEEQDFLCVQ